MATVKILYDDDAKDLEDYLKRKLEVEGPTTENLCFLDSLSQQFTRVQLDNNSKGNNSIHLIQSWSPAESKKLSREDIHAMGIELVSRFAPGHQYVVQTHTEEAHSHNHIVLNPVSIETGKRIHNKLGHIKTLREINDDIARSHGLSVLPPQNKLRLPGPGELPKRIEAYRGRSYIVDLANKADFARHHATNYDEYIAFLNAFDIDVRVETKNITYLYPGKTHGKRGRNLGPELDKHGLEVRFQKNWERIQSAPDLKRTLTELVATYRTPPVELENTRVYSNSAAARVSRRAEGVTSVNERALLESLLPIKELRRAKTHSILAYCEREKIQIDAIADGRRVLKGREHVEVSEYTWINHRNKTRGNAIDFVANHRQVGFLQAVAELNNNPRLLLLEQHLGEAKKRFQSFYIPRQDSASRADGIMHLSRLLALPPTHPVHGTLFKRQLVHVSSRGSIFFLSPGSDTGAMEYEPDSRGAYHPRKRGSTAQPFFEARGRGRELRLYAEPRTFLKFEADTFVANRSDNNSVVALLDTDLAAAHRAVAATKNIERVRLMITPEQVGDPIFQSFHAELRASLDPFSISTELAWKPVTGLALEKSPALHRSTSPERELQLPHGGL